MPDLIQFLYIIFLYLVALSQLNGGRIYGVCKHASWYTIFFYLECIIFQTVNKRLTALCHEKLEPS